ncbi:MAG TPA: FixH family protein [Ferruginibacter sp.]|nr:FixH family protein [Ferruginibacter sp.]HRO06126.1 FixH family protein [Ferruginibacter sp.]HRO97324.1 FixH family protein [Ferruginibacter sp.]HRP50561.1 FixH family protein [Ferruginibacter sp.]
MNWGNRIVVVFVLFVSGIVFMVVKASKHSQELVTTNYYEKELVYQKKIDAMNNLAMLNDSIVLTQTPEALVLELPAAMNEKNVEAVVHLYCPFNEASDQHLKASTSEGTIVIPLNNKAPGSYVVKTDWSDGTNMYYSENKIILK